MGDLAAPALDDPASSAPWHLLAEVVKQAAEQPLHFVMSAGPIWLSRCLTAVPWYGWAAVPALAYREWRQWPSKRWWDPALDAAFLVLGVIAATWSGRPPCPAPSRRAAMIPPAAAGRARLFLTERDLSEAWPQERRAASLRARPRLPRTFSRRVDRPSARVISARLARKSVAIR